MVVQNSSHILYTNYNMKFQTKMIPLNSGLTLFRSNAAVGANTEIFLKGSLPNDYGINLNQYPLMINFHSFGALNQTSIDLSLFSYTNPLTIYNEPNINISLCDGSYCIYSQTSAPINPIL